MATYEPFMRAECCVCHRVGPTCCGDFTNGLYCRDCCPHPYSNDDEYDFYGDDEDDEECFDCHMDIHGDCGLAGTEECDWECPYRDVTRN